MKDTYFKNSRFKIQDSKLRIQGSTPGNSIILNFEFSILNSRKAGAGFTLLEIMIALAVIGMTLVTVLHTVNYHTSISNENAAVTQMTQLAKEKLFELETNPASSSGSFEGADFTYENVITETEIPGIVEVKTTVKGQGKEVALRELVIRKAD
ncbi:MAG: prepilin-type N-terminal cleavage/methylation domain-containing protein [Nitrospiraceae bacterium]|nr:MAG: prepilin-type N-terminal cleavage/methylation domain-containing protein [Nitrospiraceae bacterium]